ncbi:Etoposide-induced protein 2.4 -like protein [Halotydeus destructor]|nr:Etoposide-induced protein 2.4 -like protein [Halotydeus destructor]
MGQLQNILLSVLAGTRDSALCVQVIWRLSKKKSESKSDKINNKLKRRPNPLKRMTQCGMLNGGIFLVSLLIFQFILNILFLQVKFVVGGDSRLVGTVWSWLRPLLSLTYGLLWILPLFLISRIVNALWFQDIADATFKGRPQSLKSIAKLFADTSFSLLIQAVFLVEATLIGQLPLPHVGWFISTLFLSLLYALYSFEYKWLNLGWELPKRLDYIETNWPYFLGFGLPLAIMTSYFDNFIINGCIFSILFPFFILSGNEAKPQRTQCQRFPFFSSAVWLSNELFHGSCFIFRFVKR